ncbi:hypothetical protein BCR34DRAFT_489151 [Clohesyomyces aquaticus]|uniref:Rhodopsin domain-containing protein n=1 Tax=Clohesyomyces aquaticus TaxID=1231657 RepID=A0A1Y1ZBV3_9PLEO|nr:hypothetical protein BCR34DRAFT_489151 [Clohesyomyces aquaticus]
MDPSQVPITEGHRFAAITDDNTSGYLWIVTSLCLIYSFLILVVRLHIKWKLYGLDDYTATAATVLQLGGAVPLFVALKHGLGKPERDLDDSRIEEASKAAFVAQVFILASLATAKGSVASLMLRLFTRDLEITRKPRILCVGTLALIIAFGIGSIAALCAVCPPTGLLKNASEQGHCSNKFTTWRVIAVLDISIELLLVLLPLFFVWNVQMKRYIKFQVVFAFGLRLPVTAFAIAHLHYVSGYTSTTTNVSQSMVPALVYLQVELFWALLSATVPTLKAFMKSFNSGFGMEIDIDGYGSVSGDQNHSGTGTGYPLRTLSKASRDPATTSVSSRMGAKLRRHKHHGMDRTTGGESDIEIAEIPINRMAIRPSDGQTTTSIYHSDSRRRGSAVDSDDGGSQEMIIKREVAWTVLHSDQQPKTSLER